MKNPNEPNLSEVQPDLMTGYLSANPTEKQYIQFHNQSIRATKSSYRDMWQSQADYYKSKLQLASKVN